MKESKYNIYYHLVLLFTLIYFVLFVKLDSFHMRWWDESMFAVNDYEMIENGNYFSRFLDGNPDLYTTKPPLSCWIQIVFIKLIGFNELAVRLPSAIAAALTVIILFLFLSKRYNLIYAWISAMVLLTSSGFIHFHTGRTADSDALLTLFLLCSNIYFFKYLERKESRNILLFFTFITLAFATKLYSALLFTPAYLFILIREKQLKQFLMNRNFFIGIITLIFSSVALIWLREKETPGYLHEIFYKDVGRLVNVIEKHNKPFVFYIDNLFKSRFSIWFVLLLLGFIVSFNELKSGFKKFTGYCILLVFAYLTIISLTATKVEWYDMPLYPLLSVIAAAAIFKILNYFNTTESLVDLRKASLLLILIFVYPYYSMFNKAQSNTIHPEEKRLEANERFIFHKMNRSQNLDGIKVYYSVYKGSLLFYKYKLKAINQSITIVKQNDFNISDKVLVCDDSLIGIIDKRYKYTVIESFDNAKLLSITEKLNN
ncbi:MAG: glycosyltransferase family 39 protein [Bacteroidia bacterium]|nr:glycosyltransferase family 39 protein [Bacteroidia bacterium]